MKLEARAKINLGLEITGIRQDGYHLLRSIFLELPFGDSLEMDRREQPGIRMTCTEPSLSCGEENLCVRAALALMDKYKLPGGLTLHLEKHIPLQAGLGGGSADAAAVIKGMNRLFDLQLTEEQMEALALPLGADVPFFIRGGCALAEGIGEKLTPLPVPEGFTVLLAKPGQGADTRAIYQAWDSFPYVMQPDTEKMLEGLKEGDMEKVAAVSANTLEICAGVLVPEISALKKLLESSGAFMAQMTGSGSCVFALYKEESQAREAQKLLPEQYWYKILTL